MEKQNGHWEIQKIYAEKDEYIQNSIWELGDVI